VKVLVAARSFRQIEGEHRRRLKQTGWEITESSLDRPLGADELVPLMSDVDAVIAGMDQVSAQVLQAAPRLRIVAKHGIGVDNIDVEAATRLGIWVTNASGGSEESVAELAIALMLALARNIVEQDRLVRAGQWKRKMGFELGGKILGIIGVGQIGKQVAKRGRCLGMRLLGYDVRPDLEFARAFGLEYLSLAQVLQAADFVTLHCPATRETRGMIGARELAAMKPGSYLVNTARGELVDEVALRDAITSGHLAGAALDVFATEPPVGNPLLNLPQVIVSPHSGANTREAAERVGLLAVENVIAVLNGRKPLSPVNPQVVPRKVDVDRVTNEDQG
jgi:D-3-phosphoglycerate dehydrogenase